MRLLPLILFLLSCTKEEIIPDCEHRVWYDEQRDRVRVEIVSDNPQVTVCREMPDGPHCWVIKARYYNCISFAPQEGDDVFEIIDNETCEYIL